MKKIEIMGCGYIGLPTAITFTLAGYEVCGFDGLDTVVDPPEPADVFIICVQAPYRETEARSRVSDMR